MQKIYLYLMACAMGAMSLASCSEESSTPDADGGGDGRNILLHVPQDQQHDGRRRQANELWPRARQAFERRKAENDVCGRGGCR